MEVTLALSALAIALTVATSTSTTTTSAAVPAISVTVLTGPPAGLSTAQAPAPFTELIAAYPFGSQISLSVSQDGTRAFLAEGGAIDILDVSNGPSMPIVSMDHIELPETSPYATLQYEYPSSQKRFLFIAGGTSGLWRATLCPGAFSPPTPPGPPVCTCIPAGCDRWERVQLDIAEYPVAIRKRCIDLAIVEGNPVGVPLLCALYSARNDSPVGPSELRLYKLMPDFSVVLHAVISLPSSQALATATALAVDPASSTFLYVALGIDWLWKVNLNTPSAAPTQVAGPSPTGNNRMRDLAAVRTSTQGTFIYASLDYGSIFEYSLQTGVVNQVSLNCRFADRIAAVTDGGNKVVVAVAIQDINALRHEAGWRPGHLWSDECLDWGLDDPQLLSGGDTHVYAYCTNTPGACCNELRFYRRDTTPVFGTPTQIILTQFLSIPRPRSDTDPDPTLWGSLELRRVSSTTLRTYECAAYTGTEVRDILNAFTTQDPIQQFLTGYIGPGNGSGDGPVSLRNPGLPHLNGEMRGTVVPQRLYITSPPAPLQILPLNGVECPRPSITPGSGCTFLSPFGGTLFGEANWLSSGTAGEWFFSGARTWVQREGQNCDPVQGFPGTCLEPSCGVGADRFWVQAPLPHGNLYKVGWHLIHMTPAGNPLGSEPTWNSLNIKWYQITSPSFHPTPPIEDDRTPGNDLLFSQADPRTIAEVSLEDPAVDCSGSVPEVFGGTPVLIHAVRSGSHRGYKVFRTCDLLASTHNTCGSPPTPLQGIGEPLLNPTGSGPIDYHEVITHLEIVNGGCANDDECHSNSPGPREFFNMKCHVFRVKRSSEEIRWVAVVTAGSVMTRDQTNCAWSAYSRKPMVVFYDVTETALSHFPAPVLLRVGLGSDAAGAGHAWSVSSKSYADDQTFVFVADLQGKLIVFDVSGDTLFNPIAQGIYDPSTSLRPIATLEFPRDPYDGYPPNVIDIEIDNSTAYCALGRAGVGIVDIGHPQTPLLIDILETSGVTQGILFRHDEQGRKQMLAGDLSAGLRLYGRP